MSSGTVPTNLTADTHTYRRKGRSKIAENMDRLSPVREQTG